MNDHTETVSSKPDGRGSDPASTPAGPRNAHKTAALDVSVVLLAGDWSALKPIEPVVDETARALATNLGDILGGDCATLALTSDANIAELNGTFRGKSAPTNVLAFESPGQPHATPGEQGYLGDLVMAAETLMREAEELGIPLDHHFRHLLVHGLLHLAGFDHESDATAQDMEAREIEILANLGIPNPYGDAKQP